MMPVDKGWYMRLHEAGLPSLIVSLGNDDKPDLERVLQRV